MCTLEKRADLVSLPLPTIAVVSGHTAAGGFLIAISHDYVLMRKDRGFLYMSELNIGLTIPQYVLKFLRSKIVSPMALRNVVLRASKLNAKEAMAMGIEDSAHDTQEEILEAALRLGGVGIQKM
ncbi:hypothetical protein GIB67_028647 [Kingdonia uniflora]|uniref:Enoyl-CoA hydratase/isomerase n=1 Tax=Kingdonia uniflora TaxID=39325 RepID=A0A7J7KZJ0_9MAGN|nr:hypothetical protein GIB67_028647 [Kingdonia uniflora]